MKDRIEKILKAEQISSSKFADEIGVQRSSISHLFNGRNKPSLELVQKILQRFTNINPDWLLTGKGEMYKKNINPSLFESTLINDSEKIPLSSPTISKPKSIIKDEKINNIKKENSESVIIDKPKVKTVEKVIILYSDNSFSEYLPS